MPPSEHEGARDRCALESQVVRRCADADAMQALGRRLGEACQPGHALALVGALGAGKTTFVQGLARGLGVPADHGVTSPTFSLRHDYPGRVPLVHVDLYRLTSAGELTALGLDDDFDRAVVVVEWADRFPGVLPADHLELRFAFAERAGRAVTARALGNSARALMRTL